MSKHAQSSLAYRLLKLLSRQPLQISRSIARILAGMVNVLKVSKTSETIRLNLNISLPDLPVEKREAIIRQAIRNEMTSYFEFFHIWGSSNAKNISRIHTITGEQYLHDALAEKKGVVLIVPHFGTWEIMNAWVAQHTNMTIMYKPVKHAAADQFVQNARGREQAHLVPTDESGVRQIFKALKQGGTTVILPDHTPNTWTDFVPYFGLPLASSNLSAKLIQKTKAKALFLYAIRNASDGFDMHIEPISDDIYAQDANAGTQVIHEAIEALIHQYPEHYHWSYKRFKAHPELEDLYLLTPEQALERVSQVRHALATDGVHADAQVASRDH